MAVEIPDQATFVRDWNALPLADRRRIRRLVRLGRRLAEPSEAGLGVAYSRFQRSRIWTRMFWLWFLPGLVIALAVAAHIHPLLIGIVLALAGQAVWGQHNLRRTERINTVMLEA